MPELKLDADAVARTIVTVRAGVALLIALVTMFLAGTLASLRKPREPVEAFQFIQVLESGINDVVLVGAGIFFLVTLETRIKRRRALGALRELRAVAHIIDMHQLTKDPEWVMGRTGGSRRTLITRRHPCPQSSSASKSSSCARSSATPGTVRRSSRRCKE